MLKTKCEFLRIGLYLRQHMLISPSNGLDTIPYREFLEDLVQMRFNNELTDEQIFSNLYVGCSGF